MDPWFHVYIKQAREPGPAALTRLADAVAERYGLPAAQLRGRLASGHVRVKSNVDRTTAEELVADLDRLGAVCAILDAATGLPAPPRTRPMPVSGLAIAEGGRPDAQGLGALDSGEISLATLDGAPDAGWPATTNTNTGTGPAPHTLPAGFAPASAAPSVDLFAPPTAEREAVLDLDAEARPRRSGQLSSAMPATAAPPPDEHDAAPAPRPRPAHWLADPRIRLAGGVAAAILLGFLPAHLVASAREDRAFAAIDAEVDARQREVHSEEDWRALEPMRARQLERKHEQRRDIALGSMVIWALTGGVVAFAWFRKIDWDRLIERLEPTA